MNLPPLPKGFRWKVWFERPLGEMIVYVSIQKRTPFFIWKKAVGGFLQKRDHSTVTQTAEEAARLLLPDLKNYLEAKKITGTYYPTTKSD